jgi:transposase
MEHYAGIDVSLELSHVCVVDAQGKIVREKKVASEPEALVAFFASLGFAVKRIGLEAGPLSQWLHAGLKRAGFDTVLLETRHVKVALSAMMVKTDRKDARGLAQLIRMGWFRPVHAKSMGSQEVRALLVARKLESRQILANQSNKTKKRFQDRGTRVSNLICRRRTRVRTEPDRPSHPTRAQDC